MLTIMKSLAAAAAFALGTSAFAVELYPVITKDNADYDYYRRAADVDQEYVNEGLVSVFHDYDSSTALKPIAGSKGVMGRIVPFLDGSQLNPRNLVLTVNGSLYFVRTELAAMSERITMARRWNKAENGIFLIVRGYRAGALPKELIPVNITMRIATTAGEALPAIEYYEEVVVKK